MKKKINKRIVEEEQDMILLELEARRLRDQAEILKAQADQYDTELSIRAAIIKNLKGLLE